MATGCDHLSALLAVRPRVDPVTAAGSEHNHVDVVVRLQVQRNGNGAPYWLAFVCRWYCRCFHGSSCQGLGRSLPDGCNYVEAPLTDMTVGQAMAHSFRNSHHHHQFNLGRL